MMLTNERLEELRRLATLERDAILEHESRLGADPLATLENMPSVDEFVVNELRNELLESSNRIVEFSMARVAGYGTSDEAAEHRKNADRVEFELLREIAADCPELVIAVWHVAGRLHSR